jgi:polysaccharide deacetylase family sporulation protein PdaB
MRLTGVKGRVPDSTLKLKLVSLLLAGGLSWALGGAGCRATARRHVLQTARMPSAPKADLAAHLDEHWQSAREEVDRNVLQIIEQHQAELERGTRYHKFMRGDTRKRQVAITFDDGPHRAYTPELLLILRRYNAKATFFVVGEKAQQAPNLVKAEVAGGHTVANHTYHHVDLTKIRDEDVATEIKACGEVLEEITGRAPHLFRPPGGDYNNHVAEVAEALGYITVLWTDNPRDYEKPGERLIETRVLNKIRNGAIILMHDGVQQTVDVLPQMLRFLKGKGYQLVTIDEMMGRG